MATALLFPFAEISPEIFPVDATGNMNDLGDDPSSSPALAMPDVVLSLTGRGREFGTDKGLVGTESVTDSTQLLRDFTCRVFMTYEIANASNTDRGTVIARGLQGSAAERILFGVELERVSATVVRVRARWQEADGTEAVVAGVTFAAPASGAFFQLGVSREWIDTTSVSVTYTLNDEVLGSETVTEGDIGEGDDGSLTIGCVGDGSGDYERFLPDDSIIDSIAIEGDAMAGEEIRQEFRRITVHQPNGYRLLRSYIPPGQTWAKSPTSRVQRWIAAEGDGVGYVIANAERLRDDFLPDRAYGNALEFWERITGVFPKPSATIAQRRDNVLGFLRKILGYTVADIKLSLEPLFGLDSADIDVYEYSGLRYDPFDTDDITTPPSTMWVTRAGAGTVLVTGGECNVAAVATDNIDWRTGGGDPPHRETSINGVLNGLVTGAAMITKIDLNLAPVVDVIWGHVWRTADPGEAIIIGRRLDGATNKLATVLITGGVVGSITNRLTPGSAMADPIWLLTRYKSAGTYEVGFSETAYNSGYSAFTDFSGPTEPRWAGFGIFSVIGGALVAGVDADFDDAYVFEPLSPRAYYWQAYRDTGLAGTFDRAAAQLQLDKQKPAHTIGCATLATNGLTLGPLGTGKLGCDALFPHDPTVT